MALRKEIEKYLRREDTEVDAVEDHGMKDSVLAIASTDFKENDVLDLPLTSLKRSEVDIGADYPGKPVSRKKYGKDVGAFKSEQSDDDEGALTDSSLAGLDYGLMGLDDEEEESEEEEDEIEEEEEETDEEEEFDGHSDEGGLEKELALPGSDEDEGAPLKVFQSSPAASEDIRKGQAVREQLRLWESLLECRIKLEPALVASNQLYQLDKMSAFVEEFKTSDPSEYDAVRASLQELSSSLYKLQTLLGGQSEAKKSSKRGKDEAVSDDDESIQSSEASEALDKEDSGESDPEAALDDQEEEEEDDDDDGAPPSKKQKITAEKTLDELYAEFANFRDTEMDRWNEKAKVSSGRAAQKDFSAFDQSILKLIESILFDKYRLVRKTQQKRSDYVIYGKPRRETKNDSKEDEDREDGPFIFNDKNQSKKDVVYDPEIFDDGDFYQKLLRDFIEAKSTDGGLSRHERKLMELHRLRIKMKRKVDTRATKGRKLRYVVHPKLVNFMAPVMTNTFSAEAEGQLLKSIFGQAVTSSA